MGSFQSALNTVVDVPYFSSPVFVDWKTGPIVSVALWFLLIISFTDFTVYTATFYYGTILAYRQAKGTTKFSTILIGFVFMFYRFFYLPFLLLFIPVRNLWLFPQIIYDMTLCMLFLFYFVLLILPLGFSVVWVIRHKMWKSNSNVDIPRVERKIQKRVEKGRIANIVINMPIYNEEPDALCKAVDSVCDCVYPKHRITVFLSFDNEEEDDLVRALFKHLTGGSGIKPGGWEKCVRLVYREVTFIVNMFPHGGKRHTQMLSFRQIAKEFLGREKDSFILYLDSDIVLQQDAIFEFLRSMEKNKHLIGMTGFISAISSPKHNFLWYFQDGEYVSSQIISRSFEAGLGGVTCLPGALTIVRLHEMVQAAKIYFTDLPTEDIFDFHRFHLGEDRFLTHLLMLSGPSYSLGFCPSARAKTVAPDNWMSFVKQRRRWHLGTIANEVFFLVDIQLWKKVPFLLFYKIMDYSSRSASFFLYILFIAAVSGVPFGIVETVIIWTPLFTTWLFIGLVCLGIHRLKAFIMFPLIIIMNPWIQAWVNIYAIWSWDLRSWGGPRFGSGEEEGANNGETEALVLGEEGGAASSETTVSLREKSSSTEFPSSGSSSEAEGGNRSSDEAGSSSDGGSAPALHRNRSYITDGGYTDTSSNSQRSEKDVPFTRFFRIKQARAAAAAAASAAAEQEGAGVERPAFEKSDSGHSIIVIPPRKEFKE